MLPAVKVSIEKYKDLIDREDWKSLYVKLAEKESAATIGALSEVLLSAGINPLENSKEIYPYFFAGTSLSTYEVPEGVEIIGESAFALCGGLKEITLPKSVREMKKDIFTGDFQLRKIIYRGTKEEWLNIEKEPQTWAGTLNTFEICCTKN